jgi:predicted P-loop ATPase
LDPEDPAGTEIAFRLFQVQVCAATDHAGMAPSTNESIEAHFEYVLVLVGARGTGKAKGLRRLLPRQLGAYYRDKQVLTLSDKDSAKRMASTWVAKRGELDGTFKISDVAHKNAFLSQSEDEIRAP